MRSSVLVALVVLLTLGGLAAAIFALRRTTEPPPPPPPELTGARVKLAVLVVFDQMRGDYLERWKPHFGENGFARLQRDGAHFTRCHYPHAITTTGPGHASMLTGACPDAHGIVNNNWPEGGGTVYCAGHARYRLVPPAPAFPPDPKEKESATGPKPGGCPDFLLSETVADVLKESSGGKAKVFGVSLKDRSAILPTGKRPDGAFWFYGTFGTSSYYADAVPPWVEAFNRSKAADRWFGKDWTRLRPELDYTRWSGPDDASGEGKGAAQGVTFPHPTTGGKPTLGKKYYEALASSPFANELLLEFAKACVSAEGLGADDVPDLLVVSFSSNDIAGHAWGPDSHEVLDITLRSDAVIAELLAFLDEKVGKGQYLFGITADHGICPLPEVSRAKGVEARRIDTARLRQQLDAHLTSLYPASAVKGKPGRWADPYQFPWVFLNPKLVALSGKSREEVAAEAATFLASQAGVARTFTRAALSGPVPDGDAMAVQVKRSFHPPRCGDVYVVLRPYHLPSAALGTGTTHGSPHEYDTHVPLLAYGPGIRGGPRDEPTTPQAMASIFAKWLNVRRPKDAAFPLPASLE